MPRHKFAERTVGSLPGLDVRKRPRRRDKPFAVDFRHWRIGTAAGRNMVIRRCGKCGRNAAERDTTRGKVWEHVREYWLNGKHESKSRAVQYCREIAADDYSR